MANVNLEQFGMFVVSQSTLPFKDPDRAAAQAAAWVDIRNRALAWKEKFSEQPSAILRNRALSDLGRREAIAGVANAALQDPMILELQSKRTEIIEAKTRLTGLTLNYMTRPKDRNEQELFARERELRLGFRDRPQADRDVAFLMAAQRLDAETMRALIDAPGTEPWISGEARRRGDEVFGQRNNPAYWQKIHDLDVLLEHLEGLANFAVQVLLTMGADPAKIKETLGIQSEGEAHA